MSGRLHIAYVCADRGVPVGGHKGASLHLAEMVRALIERQAEVHVLAARVADSAGNSLDGAPIADVGGSRSARRSRESILSALGSGAGATLRSEAASIAANQDMGRALERLHRSWRIDVVYERYALWGYAAAGFTRAHGIPHLLEVNAPLPEEQKRYRDLENEKLALVFQHHVFSSVSRVLVPSASLAPYVVSSGADASVVQVVPNAADPKRFRPHRRRRTGGRLTDNTFTLGFVGSLKPWHGVDDMVRVFRRLYRTWPGYRLLVVGDGPLREEAEQKLRSWGLEPYARFTGATSHEDIPQWMSQMDVALAPYPKRAPTYFSPIKIFEYMAGGVPIVASAVGQIDELLKNRRSALLHSPGAIAEMALCVEELRRKPSLRAKLSTEARAVLVQNYTWSKNAQRVLAIVRAVEGEAVKDLASRESVPVPKSAERQAAARSPRRKRPLRDRG